MKRLTKKIDNGRFVTTDAEARSYGETDPEDGFFYNYFTGEAVDKLAAYEDTGLEPADIKELLAAVPANRVDYKWLNASNSVIATMTIEKYECGWTSLSNFEIAEAYRGQGLSHKLIEFAKTKGVNNLSVDPNNSIAINLYQQHGFFLTGETDGNLYRMRLTKPPKEDAK